MELDPRPSLRRRQSIAVALVALLALAVPAGALAQAPGSDAKRDALATERYLGSYDAAAAKPGSARAALAQERYLSSYGAPSQPSAPATSTRAASDVGLSWTTTILGGALLIAAAAGLGMVVGRASVRPHGAGA